MRTIVARPRLARIPEVLSPRGRPCRPRRSGYGPRRGGDTTGFKDSIELGVDHIDTDISMAEQLGELKSLQDEGKVESLGLSNATVDEIAAALGDGHA
jgi:diketogulonate reductase-like aldo/keto reductase